jgi:adenylosuccinate lyase
MVIHPIDYRYLVKELTKYIGEEAYLNYKLRVEKAYANALAKLKICSPEVAREIGKAIEKVKLEEVRSEESKVKHEIVAMVNVLKEKVSPKAKPWVHLGLTSYDVVNTAQSLMLRDVTSKLILPDMISLERKLIELARRERGTLQMGRTHGQHAEPTTFGKEMAFFVDRWGRVIERVYRASKQLRGKISGAVGTKASLELLCDDPDSLEKLVMQELGLKRARITTQILPPEENANYFLQIILAFSTLADLANDMRQLQRNEIGEVWESFAKEQVGSSAMPQKRNPITWENIISQYRAVMPHAITCLLNIEGEHQRDLRDSASMRYLIAEVLDSFDYCVRRASKGIEKLEVDREAMLRNLSSNKNFWMAEPAYILLSLKGHPNAHSRIQNIAFKAIKEGKDFYQALKEDEEFSKLDIEKIKDAKHYLGKAKQMVNEITRYWEKGWR